MYKDTYNLVNNKYNTNIENNNVKKTIVNIDSEYRNKIPNNIINNIINITADSLYFSTYNNVLQNHWGAYYMYIYIENHKLLINEKIILTNLWSNTYISKNNILIFNYDDYYVKILHSSHNLVDKNVLNFVWIETIQNDDYYVTIWNFTGNKYNNKYFENLWIWVINNTHKIYFVKSSNEIYDNNFYYILLPIKPKISYEYKNDLTLSYKSIFNINLKYINANYPINIYNNQGYHVIDNVINENYIRIKLSKKIYGSNINDIISPSQIQKLWNGAGSSFNIAKIIDSIEGFPNPNYYTINLPKTFNNVFKMELLSTEIPNSDFNINNKLWINQNNSFYWSLIDDADVIYWTQINQGIYTLDEIIKQLITNINKTKRNNNYILNIVSNSYYLYTFNFVDIKYNKITNIINFSFFNQYFSDNIITPIPNSWSFDYNINKYTGLTIIHSFHNLNVGDTITLSNIQSFNKIPADVLNTSFTIFSIIDNNTYSVKLPQYVNNGSSVNFLSGTNNTINYKILFKIHADYSDSICSVLNFKNVGDINSVTPYLYEINNTTNYFLDNNEINSVGLSSSNYLNKIIDLSGHNYIFLCIPIFDEPVIYNNINNIFAKLLMVSPPGYYNFNQFIQMNYIISPPKKNICNLSLSFYTKDGKLYEFNNIDHSFT